jgi:hypothetical protein
MSTYLLVHGGWHGGWYWGELLLSCVVFDRYQLHGGGEAVAASWDSLDVTMFSESPDAAQRYCR